MSKPALSIVIPTLNEAETLPCLLSDLSCQKGITLEVIVSDGGSSDETPQRAKDCFSDGQLLGDCLVVESNRGKQLNAGAAAASSDWLLFLHADSRIEDESQLHEALQFIKLQQRQKASDQSAGRFTLCFDSSQGGDGFGLFFYEAKASLGRPGCIHGDQGMLLTKSFFYKVGPFREDLPVMEDTTLAESIRASGDWLLLPGKIVTSSRRFRVEGLKARQTLNALMMNFHAIGWLDFFIKAPDVYRQQDRTQPLQLLPFFQLIRDLLNEMSLRDKLRVWLSTGGYVRSQAWQIGLALDCRKAYRRTSGHDHRQKIWLEWFDRWFNPLTNHCVGRTVTALLVRLWFSWQIRRKPECQQPRRTC